MDLSMYDGCWVGSVSTSAGWDGSRASIALCQGPETVVTLEFSDVVYFVVDGLVEGLELVEKITSRVLPRDGAWPAEAHDLIHHHDNVAELTWVVLDGPTRIEVLAGSLALR